MTTAGSLLELGRSAASVMMAHCTALPLGMVRRVAVNAV